MADAELTSESGSDNADAEMTSNSSVQVTSPSEDELPAQAPKSSGRGRARGQHGTTWLHHPKTKPDMNVEEETSESSETARIQDAARRAKAWSKQEHTSSSDHGMQVDASTDMGSASMPKTSGVFDYTLWLVGKLSSHQRGQLLRGFRFMDLCAGLGTSLLAYEALRVALRHYGLDMDGACTGLTEMDDQRREALSRRCASIKQNPVILKSNGCLTLQCPKDAHGNPVDVPLADVLFMGIVCVDISRCSSTPKSITDPEGASGKSWNDLLNYLDQLPLAERPKSIILECVDNLDHNRAVQGHTEKGTLIILEALRERGYVGQWKKALASRFAVPQSRPRVWGLFLKLHDGIGPKAVEAREHHLEQAFDIIRQGETSGYEPLELILAPCPHSPDANRPDHKRKPKGEEWKNISPKYQSKHGLTDEDITMGQADFTEATNGIILPREQSAVWHTLCMLRKKGRIPNWKDHVLVSDCGSSLGWLSIASGKFPCLRPGNKYLVLQHGVAYIAQGSLCLAVQGIGPTEQHALNLNEEAETLKRPLAGNAFCANICAAFLVGALSTLT